MLPSKMLEAMATAKPVILGVEGHAATLLKDAGAGLCIQPENDAALVEAVEALAADRSPRDADGRSGTRLRAEAFRPRRPCLGLLNVPERFLEARTTSTT